MTMRVRNLPFDNLNDIEQQIVIKHFNEQHKIQLINGLVFFECEHHKKCNSLSGFWECHRDLDTENGKYNKWRL